MNFAPGASFNPYQGYGKVEQALAYALTLAGVELTFFGDLTPEWHTLGTEMRLLGQGGGKMHPVTLTTIATDKARVWPLRDTRQWLYTMIETTRLGDGLVKEINDHVERVLVPVPRLVDVFYESGVKKPVHCVGYGTDFAPPPWVLHRRPEGGPFVFLSYSQGDLRKGAEMAVSLYQQLFGDDPSYQLWIKARDGYTGTWLDGLHTQPMTWEERLDSYPTDANREALYCPDMPLFHYADIRPRAQRDLLAINRERGIAGLEPLTALPDGHVVSKAPYAVPFAGRQPLDPHVIGARAPFEEAE